MKKIVNTILLSSIFLMQTGFARTVEIDVFGMTCAFCVDSLERKFNKMESVSKVEVSLKLKKIRLQTEADSPTVAAIKKAILDAGFTPVKIEVINDSNKGVIK